MWHVFHKDYSKHDKLAYTELASSFDTTTDSIKTKINGLRVQLGRELSKVILKSGQRNDELYTSSWIHYNRLSLMLLLNRDKRDTLKRKNSNRDDESEVETGYSPAIRKRITAEKKLLYKKSIVEMCRSYYIEFKKIRRNPDGRRLTFALYVE